MSRTPPDSRKKRTAANKTAAKQAELFLLPADRPDYCLEIEAGAPGRPVAGADEAGRGPLAGPVVAAAVILDPENIPPGLDDSKKLTAKKRQSLFDLILATAEVAVASSGPTHIDRTDIRKASLDAMRRALAALPRLPEYALIDGRDVPPGLRCRARAVIKGDARSLSIAAASIVAKVMRDRMMERSAADFPDFGFDKHAGYGTAAHRKAIADNGPCSLHRMSFRPMRSDP
ncbi:ribonuclease HII [Hoeflea sp. TYP-13]|uniref:ribonuclease HII n=1 Tax=Hoeflea sp. TYP-13 TaxID=3230023 RepID=UPI0034C6B4B1